MDRRYYKLKALVIAAGIAVALASSLFGARPQFSPMAHIHYSAAAAMQSAVTEATLKLSRVLIRHGDCILPFGL